jgi:hypothetical protein
VFDPVKDTFCGLLAALSVMVSVPLNVPATVGEKVTPMMQLLFAARLAPQGLELTAKGAAVEMLVMVSAVLLALVSVTV